MGPSALQLCSRRSELIIFDKKVIVFRSGEGTMEPWVVQKRSPGHPDEPRGDLCDLEGFKWCSHLHATLVVLFNVGFVKAPAPFCSAGGTMCVFGGSLGSRLVAPRRLRKPCSQAISARALFLKLFALLSFAHVHFCIVVSVLRAWGCRLILLYCWHQQRAYCTPVIVIAPLYYSLPPVLSVPLFLSLVTIY